MATKLTVTLSDKLQKTLSSTQNGKVGVWAVYFTFSGDVPHAVPLTVKGGTPAKPTTIDLPSVVNGGKVYFIIQSIDPSDKKSPKLLAFGKDQPIALESDLNWVNADKYQFRYDSFEVSLLGAAADAGNLTNVEYFGIPMSVEIAYPNGLPDQERGYAESGSQVFTDIKAINTAGGGLVHQFKYGPLAGQDRLAASPKNGADVGGTPASDWYAYVESIGMNAAGKVQVAGQFNGAPSVEYVVGGGPGQQYSRWHNPGFYSYTLAYEAKPWTVYSASATLGADPFQAKAGQNAITVTDPNASQYKVGQTKVTLAGAEGFAGFSAADLSGEFVVANIIDANHYIIIANKNAAADDTGGGDNVTSATPLAADPFQATAGDAFFTVTDPLAASYANAGVEVSFDGAGAFASFTADYLNSTTFTITELVDATHYRVQSTTVGQTGNGGGPGVAPTYVRPEAGTYVLSPTANSQIQGTIRISSQDLANSIYATLGSAQIIGLDGQPYGFTKLVSNVGVATNDLNTGANSQWGNFFTKLLPGFVGGYFGADGKVLEPWQGGPSSVDLSKNWNFDPTYAFDSADKQTPWSWDKTQFGTGVLYDRYAQVFFQHTNSYGNGYSDELMKLFQEGGPLVATGYAVPLAVNPFTTQQGSKIVTIADPNAGAHGYKAGDLVTFAGAQAFAGINMAAPPQLGTTGKNAFTIVSVAANGKSYTVEATSAATSGASGGGPGVVAGYDVPAIELTLFDDNETPPAGGTLAEHQNYTPTVIYNKPADGTLVDPRGAGGGTDLTLRFGLGLGQMRPRDDLVVSLGFFKGNAGQPQFDRITFDSTQSLFQQWSYDAASKSLKPMGQAAASGSDLAITGLSYVSGVNWYQLTLADPAAGGDSRTYNIYLDAAAGQGIFNPNYVKVDPDNLDAIGIDSLGAFVPSAAAVSTEYVTDLQFNMFNGGTLSMPPSLLERITDQAVINNPGNVATWQQPKAPVLGTLSGKAFANWGGSTASQTPNSLDSLNKVNTGALAFGWWGADQTWVDNSYANQVVAAFTNQIGALNSTYLTFASGAGLTAHDPIAAIADLDGRWTTAAGQFGEGTYRAMLTEYASGDSGHQTPLGRTSLPLDFTVKMKELPLQGTPDGSGLQLRGGDGTGGGAAQRLAANAPGTAGNWVRLEAGASFLPHSATLLAYLTDRHGALVGRDGSTGAGVTLHDAVIGRLGWAAGDQGAMLLRGHNSVYLPVGRHLRFAVLTGDGEIELTPDVRVKPRADGSLQVVVDGLKVSAEVDNTLSPAAALARGQRQGGDALMHLGHGETMRVEIAGSSDRETGTLGLVRIDVDPASGRWSVGGVAYGPSAAFAQAVRDNLDAGLRFRGGGDFARVRTWIVDGPSGYYAPVLITHRGEVIVAGDANSGGYDHIRVIGENTFAIESRPGGGSDFDHNDMVVRFTPTDTPLVLRQTVAEHFAPRSLVLASADDIVLRDAGAALGGLSAMRIADLAGQGVVRLDATDDTLTLDVAQLRALGTVALTRGDEVVLADTGARLARLTAAEMAALAGRGVDRLDATDGVLALDVAQLDALGRVALSDPDLVTLRDRGIDLAGLAPAEIAGLAARGIDGVDASDRRLVLTLRQFERLGEVRIEPSNSLTVAGTAGDDRFDFRRQTLGASDRVVGSGGDDTLLLAGDYSAGLAFGPQALGSIERLVLSGGSSYSLAFDNGNVAAGETLVVKATALGPLDALALDGSAITGGGRLRVEAGVSVSTFTGGRAGDHYAAGASAGTDTLRYTEAAQSTSTRYDTIAGFDALDDLFDVWTEPTEVDAPLTSGALSASSFDADLAAAMAGLAAGHAVLFAPDAGNLAGRQFLVVDTNGVAGYQPGGDLVVRLDSAANMGAFGAANLA